MTAKPSTSSKKKSSSSAPPLNDWIAQHLAPNAQVQVRLRGNILHALCETPNTLHQAGAMARLVDALLDQTAGVSVITDVYPQVYQVYLYSRRTGQTKPDWTAPLYLNRLERHRAQLQQYSTESLRIVETQSPLKSPGSPAEEATAWPQDDASTTLVLSNLSLARQGDPDAIAWYLSEVLSTLDVGVWVSIRAVPGTATVHPEVTSAEAGHASTTPSSDHKVPRLWVLCEATYSPDPLLIAEPVTERLRQLALTQFKDAVIVIQVHGEDSPDWSLRIDLTPPDEMLREWGRWGDEAAISRLVNQALAPLQTQVTTERKDASLHLMAQGTAESQATAPAETSVIQAITPLLTQIAPQGIHRAMVYGQVAQAETPEWVRCVNLPALEHEALAADPKALAQQGDLPALAYLLTRLLNPDLEAQLATGGIRVQTLRRENLLHVMADAPVCPTRRQVAPSVLDFLKTLDLEGIGIKGVRLYGRRAGQQRPAWSYGSDFQERERLVPKAEPTFAASDAYVGDLLTAPEEDALRADLTPEVIGTTLERAWQWSLDRVRGGLVRTQLFVPQSDLPRTPPPLPARDRHDALKISLVWGLVGALLALQADWLLGQVLNPAQSTTPTADAAPAPAAAAEEAAPQQPQADDDLLPQFGWEREAEAEGDTVFAGDEFTQDPTATDTANTPFTDELQTSPDQSLAPTPDLLQNSPYPPFRSQQLNEKLALYHQRLQESGPPDVLIMGSSRALRGVDPAALRKELSALGFGEPSIFNFGINGATAQVVELTLRRILEADQLPRLVLWADGARAFNSGRTDVTYNGIATSEGYREFGQRDLTSTAETEIANDPATDDPAEPQSVGDSFRESYQALDQKLSEQLGQWSAIYGEREQLKAVVRDYILTPLVAPIAASVEQHTATQNTSDMPIPEGSRIDFDGFLALDVRFNPATYYQLYARVPGVYDSDYENFELQGVQFTAFQQLLNYTQSKNIPMVFVNTPLTDEYLDNYRMAAEEDFQRMMLQHSATEALFIFRDLGQLWDTRYDYFSDPSHLNRYGAYQVSERLAQDPMIPWPRALESPVPDSEATP
ncbi:MAG: DUF1574 domain-containing protein [Leptolyngbya sp. SIO1E4]|nr:DUF1574 domain-containing protein [Leptolyngbya sp. SIO1E4]